MCVCGALEFNFLNPAKKELLASYANFLLKWNRIHSLSGAKNLEEIYLNIDLALYPLTQIHLFETSLLLDIGSGNGFPAIPLCIALNVPTILCEPNAKKAAFLQNCKAHLALKHLHIARSKIESLHLQTLPDLITSRATFSLNVLLSKSSHCIKKTTTLLLYKGSNVIKEIPQNLTYKHFCFHHTQYIIFLGKELL